MSNNDIGIVNPTMFEWIIPSFREWLESEHIIYSPNIRQQDSTWYLSLISANEEWIGVSIYRVDSGGPKTITYTIKVKGRTDVAEITKTNLFNKDYCYGETKFLKKEEIQDFIFLDSLIITCYITCDIPHPMPGKEFVTSGVQTEVPDSTSCGIHTDIANIVDDKKPKPHKDEWSQYDTKGVAILSDRMKELLIKGGDHDMTISVQKKEFRTHRSILCARSPVFAMMLAHDSKENNTGTINIEDCDPESFDEFLLYVYSGRTENLAPNNALQLYYTADKYDFPVLKERCVSLLKTSLSVESICDVVFLATRHHEKELLEVATEFFAQNMRKILVTVGWQNFMLQNPVEANELYIKTMDILHPEN